VSTDTGQRHLEALLESAQLLQKSLDLDDLLRHLLRSVMGRFLARRGVIAIDRDGQLSVAAARGASELTAGSPFHPDAAKGAGIDILMPIGTDLKPIGYLGISRPPAGDLDEADLQFLTALLGIAASGIATATAHQEMKRLNVDLQRRVHELRTLLDVGRGFTSTVEPEQVASLLALTLAGQWALRRHAVMAWKEGQPPLARIRGLTLPSTDGVRAALENVSSPILTAALEDTALRDDLEAQQVAVIIPIRSGDELVGAALAGKRPGGLTYAETDMEFAAGLAAQAAVAFDNAWHFQSTLEKEKIEKELQLAADIQRRLLPAAMPLLERLDVVARTRPARQVGGDYYDVIPFGGEQLFCVADVSGKGIAASLLMSNFQATLRALASSGRPLPEIVARMNELIYASTASNKYVTSIFVAIDPATGQGHYVNGGHNEGIILRADGTDERLKASGMSVGLMPGRPYTERPITLGAGDVVILYSDGVTEANDVDENEFEIERLIACVRDRQPEPADAIVSAIFESVDRFAGAAPQYDDITAMIIARR
jgi:sigma-B regulation protein RsbU (phosphoserine phosphatase)